MGNGPTTQCTYRLWHISQSWITRQDICDGWWLLRNPCSTNSPCHLHEAKQFVDVGGSRPSFSQLGLCGSISITGWFHVHTTIHYILNQFINKTYIYTYIDMFNGPFSRTTWVSRHQKGKLFWILLKQEMMGGSGISWTTCTACLQLA